VSRVKKPRCQGVKKPRLNGAGTINGPEGVGELSPRFQLGKVRRDALLTADSRDILGRRVIKPRVRPQQ
jgi:hypothetical protein